MSVQFLGSARQGFSGHWQGLTRRVHGVVATALEFRLPREDEMWVYSFGDGGAEGSARMRELLGGKGADLAEYFGLMIL